MSIYTVDDLDSVSALPDVPVPTTGAPVPLVMADENSLSIAYYVSGTDRRWGVAENLACAVHFIGSDSFFFGAPNDEAFQGHPLASRGLRPYGAFEILQSSLVRTLEAHNRVHSGHALVRGRYASLRHFVIVFHDSTFECVAQGFRIVVGSGSLLDLLLTFRTQQGTPSA